MLLHLFIDFCYLSVDKFFGTKFMRFHITSLVYHVNITQYIIKHYLYTKWTLLEPIPEFSNHHRTSLVYHVNIIKYIIEHHIYTIWTSHVYYVLFYLLIDFFGTKSVRFYRTSLLYHVNITKYIIEHLKIWQVWPHKICRQITRHSFVYKLN
jgi:hypothetical protein